MAHYECVQEFDPKSARHPSYWNVVAGIDKLVGNTGTKCVPDRTRPAQKSSSATSAEVLRETAGAWKSEDPSELGSGADTWIRQMRSSTIHEFEELERHRDGK